jgi:hypothetical protein
MTDLTDEAEQIENMHRESAILAARKAAQRDRLPETGECHHCGEETRPGARFCDSDCRDGWQREQDARRRAGRLDE